MIKLYPDDLGNYNLPDGCNGHKLRFYDKKGKWIKDEDFKVEIVIDGLIYDEKPRQFEWSILNDPNKY